MWKRVLIVILVPALMGTMFALLLPTRRAKPARARPTEEPSPSASVPGGRGSTFEAEQHPSPTEVVRSGPVGGKYIRRAALHYARRSKPVLNESAMREVLGRLVSAGTTTERLNLLAKLIRCPHLDRDAVAALLHVFDTCDDRKVRWAVVEVLAYARDERQTAEQILARMETLPEAEVPYYALTALPAQRLVLDFLADRYVQRTEARENLAHTINTLLIDRDTEIDPRPYFEFVKQQLPSEPDESVRFALVRVLLNSRDPAQFEFLAEQYQRETSERIRADIAMYVSNLAVHADEQGQERIRRFLKGLVEGSSSRAVQAAAQSALTRF